MVWEAACSMSLPVQLHLTAAANPLSGKLKQQQQFANRNPVRLNIINKPANCFWTSSLDTRGGSAWAQFCYDSDFRRAANQAWLIFPHRTARVLKLAEKVFTDSFREKYTFCQQRYHLLDWEALAQDYDAVWLPRRYEICPTDVEYYRDFYAWDVESTVWLRPRFYATYRGKFNFNVYERSDNDS